MLSLRISFQQYNRAWINSRPCCQLLHPQRILCKWLRWMDSFECTFMRRCALVSFHLWRNWPGIQAESSDATIRGIFCETSSQPLPLYKVQPNLESVKEHRKANTPSMMPIEKFTSTTVNHLNKPKARYNKIGREKKGQTLTKQCLMVRHSLVLKQRYEYTKNILYRKPL